MKRFLILIAALALSSTFAGAQDLITKKDGQDIKAKVIEVGPNEIKYELYDEPEGIVYTVKKSEILLIRYESGRNEVFRKKSAFELYYPTNREPVEGLTAGMKYQDLKNLYNTELYMSAAGDRYSLIGAGIASFLVPGLGQILCGETERGLMFFGGFLGGQLIGIAIIAYGANFNYSSSAAFGTFFSAYAILAGSFAVGIYSIVDAVRVAKVKNMYEQDLMRSYSLEASLFPSVNYTVVGGAIKPAAGLTLSLKF